MDAGPPRARRREAPDVRREQLLAAARALVVERGVRATTMAAVADAAGVAKGTTYLYFASKDDLVEAVRSAYLDEFAAALLSDGAAAAPERLDRFVDGLFRFAAEHHVLHHALIHDAGTSESEAMAGALAILEPIIAAGADDGSFRIGPHDTRTATTFVLHGIHAAVVATLHGDGHGAHRPIGDAELDSGVACTAMLARRAVGARAT